MATVQQTIEFKTLLKNKGKLTNLFRTYISLWSDKLYTNGLISQEVFETETDNNADATKAKEMTMCVLDCVSKDPGKYSVFMSTLKAFGEQYGAGLVYDDLTEDYEDILAGKVEEAANSDSELLYAFYGGDLLGSTSNAPLATTLPSAQDEQTVVTTQGGSQGDDRPSENRSSEEKSSSVIAEQPRFNNDDKRKMQEKSNGIRVESEAPESFMSEVVVLIQTVKQEEQLAVYEHMKPPTAEMKAPITWICEHPKIALTLGMFGDHKTAVIRTKKGGNCQSEIVYALNKLPNVKLIIAVGFAYGRRKKCSLGDVIVSTTVAGVTELRCENDKTNLGEGTVRYTEMKLSAQTAFSKQEWMDFNCIKTGNRNSVVHTGVILSSPVLLNDRKVLQDFLKNNSRFIGGEMEGQQLALCTHQFLEDNKREVDFIVIKGVADFGDGTKEGNWQLTASLAAAKYAEESLSKTNGQVYKLQAADHPSKKSSSDEGEEKDASNITGPPSPVKDLMITNNLEDCTVTFMWTYDNAVNTIPATSFNVIITPINGGNPITETVSIDNHSLTLPLSQLVSEASYCVSVVATNNVGESDVIENTFTSPGPPSPVKDLTITNNLDDHTVTFMWTYDNAVNTIPATSFNVTVTPVNGGIPITEKVSIDDHSLTLPLSQLVSEASYRVSVVATNRLGRSVIIDSTFTSPDVYPLHEMYLEDYTCVARSVIGFVYLPSNIHVDKINISVVPDLSLYPKTTAYEVSVAPVVSISCQAHKELLGTELPMIIEIMMTAELFNRRESDKNIISLSRYAHLSDWEEIREKCDVLKDRIRIRTNYFKYFTAIARFPPPTASVTVDPTLSEPAHPVELCVPELPGFKVLIPLKSVPYKTEIKATLYYDSRFCENSNETLATACVELEPHSIAFSENVLVQLPIPGYSSIIKENPDAKLILLYSPTSTCTNWTKLHNISVNILNVKGESFATFQTKRHSILKLSWQGIHKMSKFNFFNFNYVNSILGRCEVFMTREVDRTSTVNFSIRAEVCPFARPEQGIPLLYHYILYHSGSNPIEFIPGELHFVMKLKDCLFLTTKDEEQTKSSKIFQNSTARAEFDVDLDTKVKCELIDGAVVAQLRIVQEDCDRHQCNLIKSFPEGRENTVLQHPEAQYDQLKITMHPTCDPTKRCKQGLVLTLRATGSGTLTYQWIKDETPILTEDFLPNCKGFTSDSLKFTDLQPEHSGSYKCKVTSSLNRQSVESNTAIFEVQETMELTEFISGNSVCTGIVTVSEKFENYVDEYLQDKMYTLAEGKDGLTDIIAQIYKHGKRNYDEATIDFKTKEITKRDKEAIGEAKLIPNKANEDRTENFTKTVKYTEGSTQSTNTYSGWTVDGRLSLSAGLESVGVPIKSSASAGLGYKKGESETNTQATGTERTESFDKDIHVPKKTQVKVSVEKIVTTFKCDVSNVKVIFNTSDSIKYRVRSRIITSKKKKLTKIFKIAKDPKAQEFTIPMNGKFLWSETCLYLNVSDPMPLQ